jgi:ATP-binding cassette subfamily B (MDR/TAP) protein 1
MQAASNFDRLTKFDMLSCESHGNIHPGISGTIRFNNINFTYPERPDALF